MVINVSRGAFVSIDLNRQNCLIGCLAGKLWVTKTGDGMDHCLEADEKCDFSGSGKIVIGAVADASIEICGEPGFAVSINEGNVWKRNDLERRHISQHFQASKKYNSLFGKCC